MSTSPLPSPSARRRGRLWLFRLIGIGCGLLPLVLLEGGLRLGGFGHDLRLIVPVNGAPGWYQLNSRFDEPYFGRADLSGPEPRPFRLPKPPGTRRILVVGGSTVVGFPYSSDVAFPRICEQLLDAQKKRGESVEVLNAGITAINSSTEVAVVQEGLQCQPDVIVVYTGHNEFYGPGGVASGVFQFSPPWFRGLARLGRLRIFQLARHIARSWQPLPGDLVDTFSKNVHVELDGPLFRAATQRFEDNLETMIATAGSARIPVVLAGPVANERNQPPIEPALPPAGNPDEPAWYASVRTAERHLQYDAPAKALEALQAISPDDQKHAIVQYRLAQAADQAGDLKTAAVHYQAALDLDGGRFRAPSAFGAVMQRLAQKHAAKNITYLDVRAAVCRDDPDGIPGRRHFWEHVHFTWDGNVTVARAVAEWIQQTVWSQSWDAERSLTDEQLRDSLPLQPEEHLAAIVLTMLLYEKPPFKDAADAQRLTKDLAWQAKSDSRQLTPARQAVFDELPSSAMSGDLLATLIARCRAEGLDDEVGQLLKAAVRRRPWQCQSRNALIEWLTRHKPEHADTEWSNRGDWPCQ